MVSFNLSCPAKETDLTESNPLPEVASLHGALGGEAVIQLFEEVLGDIVHEGLEGKHA